MRSRILRVTLGISLTVIALMTVAMLWGHWVGARSSATAKLEREADQVAQRLDEALAADGDISRADLEAVVPAGSRLELQTDERALVVGSSETDGPTVVEHGNRVGTITLTDTSGSLSRALAVGSALIVVVAAALAALAVVVAVRASRWATEPLGELVEDAQRLGAGDLRPSGRRYGVEELDQLSAALDAATRRVAQLLADERSVTMDATHQLKTPLTALSLRLEELAETPDDPDVRAEAAAALEQVERLSALVDALLSERRWASAGRQRSPLVNVIEQQLTEWRPAYQASSRELVAEVDEDTSVTVDRGPVGQVVATLIENSLVHGDGRTTVSVRTGSGVTSIEVFDEGPGVSDALAPRVFDRDVSGAGGTGLGLAAAQDAAVSVGGRISLVRRRPAHFRFFLEGREDPSPVGPEPEGRPESDADDVGGDVVGQR
jgi:signal transduction histidine kinase